MAVFKLTICPGQSLAMLWHFMWSWTFISTKFAKCANASSSLSQPGCRRWLAGPKNPLTGVTKLNLLQCTHSAGQTGGNGCKNSNTRYLDTRAWNEPSQSLKLYNHIKGPLVPPPGWKRLLLLSHLRHYAKRVLTPRSLNVKLGPRRNYHKGRAAIKHYANQTKPPVPYDFCVADRISRWETVGSTPV